MQLELMQVARWVKHTGQRLLIVLEGRDTAGKTGVYGAARDAMLKATHTEAAPWTLVDFNDQRRGRLTLIRHLLDHLPDVAVPEAVLAFKPLAGWR